MELELGLDPDGDSTTYSLTRIAGYYHMWTAELPQYGYPSGVVVPLIKEVEKELLESVVDNKARELKYEVFLEEASKLANALNQTKSKLGLKTADVEFFDDCGGGGVLTVFKMSTGARMFMLPTFFIRLCQVQGIDHSDRSKCNHYKEVFDGGELMLAGIYTYVAEWPDGHTKTGQFDAWTLPQQKDEDKHVFHLNK